MWGRPRHLKYIWMDHARDDSKLPLLFICCQRGAVILTTITHFLHVMSIYCRCICSAFFNTLSYKQWQARVQKLIKIFNAVILLQFLNTPPRTSDQSKRGLDDRHDLAHAQCWCDCSAGEQSIDTLGRRSFIDVVVNSVEVSVITEVVIFEMTDIVVPVKKDWFLYLLTQFPGRLLAI